jgi:hypothetical protein
VSLPLRAQAEALACPACRGVACHCPTCGDLWRGTLPADADELPRRWEGPCPSCGTLLVVAVVGWGEWPDPAGCLSDRLPDPLAELENAYRLPPAQRPTAHRPRPAATAVAAPPAPPPRPPRPAPPTAPRHRIASWRAWGLLPEGLSPSSIAAAYARVTGCPAPRDPTRKHFRAYSAAELALALAELGYPPPPDPLPLIWAAALDRIELPSSRRLLLQQARLLRLDERRALVGITHPWGAMAQTRLPLLERALAAAIGSPRRAVVLELLPEGVAR